jgi:hypothetical protein
MTYIRVIPGASSLVRSLNEAHFNSERCPLAVKRAVVDRFAGRCLNIGNQSGVSLTTWTVNSLLDQFPLTHRGYLQGFVGPTDGFLFEIQTAEWTLNSESAVFTFRLAFSSSAGLLLSRDVSAINWPAVETNLRAYLLAPIPDYLKGQAQLRIEMNGNLVQGQLIVPN